VVGTASHRASGQVGQGVFNLADRLNLLVIFVGMDVVNEGLTHLLVENLQLLLFQHLLLES
jgi:hypothetical protein